MPTLIFFFCPQFICERNNSLKIINDFNFAPEFITCFVPSPVLESIAIIGDAFHIRDSDMCLLLGQGLAIPSFILAKRDGMSDCNGGWYLQRSIQRWSGRVCDLGHYYAFVQISDQMKMLAELFCLAKFILISFSPLLTKISISNFFFLVISFLRLQKNQSFLSRVQPWQKSSGNIYCILTQTCTASKLTGSSKCQNRSETLSGNVETKIQEVTLCVSYFVSLDNQQCQWRWWMPLYLHAATDDPANWIHAQEMRLGQRWWNELHDQLATKYANDVCGLWLWKQVLKYQHVRTHWWHPLQLILCKIDKEMIHAWLN